MRLIIITIEMPCIWPNNSFPFLEICTCFPTQNQQVSFPRSFVFFFESLNSSSLTISQSIIHLFSRMKSLSCVRWKDRNGEKWRTLHSLAFRATYAERRKSRRMGGMTSPMGGSKEYPLSMDEKPMQGLELWNTTSAFLRTALHYIRISRFF